jgi:hypothetical protein
MNSLQLLRTRFTKQLVLSDDRIKNHERIGDAICEANLGLHRLVQGWKLILFLTLGAFFN